MDEWNFPLSVVVVIGFIVGGILFTGALGPLTSRPSDVAEDATLEQTAASVIWREAVPSFVGVAGNKKLSLGEKHLVRSQEFYDLANMLHDLALITRPHNPEVTPFTQKEDPRAAALREKIDAAGPLLVKPVQVLVKLTYFSKEISALNNELAQLDEELKKVSDNRKKSELNRKKGSLRKERNEFIRKGAIIQQWVAVTLGVAGEHCGDWFAEELAGHISKTTARDVDDMNPKARELAGELAALSDKPLPADIRIISGPAREIVRKLGKMPESEAWAFLAAVYSDDWKNRPWLKIIGAWFAGNFLFESAWEWFGEKRNNSERPKPFVRNLLVYSISRIPGGREMLLEKLPALTEPGDRRSVIQALARGKYMPALPVLKRMAHAKTSHIEGFGGPEAAKTSNQINAAIALRHFATADVASFCRSLFDNENIRRDARGHALESFAAIVQENAIDDLAGIFHLKDDEEEKLAVVGALWQIKTVEAFQFLDEVSLFDPSVRIRGRAEAGANKLRGEIGDKLENTESGQPGTP
ncbi:MAG: hypothetical protein E3J72_10865 [Planctomycetota bacterium]|nr:MAG: hypothetical protein E3J72_10865 [Planctomycetota bacterium]